ncbi:MAG: SDR family oxidoreductase [Elusimicrobia bacterium]|jgi:NAD(P)-dependent dehydrogenase (short-subunit alcohol dehydrogenase family)|nr:SDR family oxidoreductase [Elusimicrobiota bacterium]MBK7545715.1 SDR family oxidoreductase [Elusimicrobiota bacterium]MBK7574979.1 SDR family oxidoreductase [Elusimicrobiota bacterium]MBK7687755.1 SDR family oxidoreductase [Elusimicrobiota bacterium]MBK8125324.1 SDR family oxidoreductase [Elusimicrobiota bacterium]
MNSPVVLITGASSGIGRAAARQFAARGWRVAVAARRKERLDALAAEIVAAGGAAPFVLPADVSHPHEARAAVASAADHFGRLDVLVNNAGVLRMAPFLAMPVEEMREIFETNFWATVETVRAAAGVMEKQGGGRIVQVGSGVGRRGLPFMAAYAASKFALLGLTESLRLELGPRGISLSLVLPGGTDTEMPNNLDRSRLPPGYPQREGYRVSADRAARAVVKAALGAGPEIYVPWWVRPGAWLSSLWPSLADRIIKKGYRTVQWK